MLLNSLLAMPMISDGIKRKASRALVSNICYDWHVLLVIVPISFILVILTKNTYNMMLKGNIRKNITW